MVTKDEARVAEANSALERLKAEGGTFDSAMPSAGPNIGHGPDAARAEDAVEHWARIIGRTLRWGAALFLAWQFRGAIDRRFDFGGGRDQRKAERHSHECF